MRYTAHSLACLSLEELPNPITYRYAITTPWGALEQDFTVDCLAIGTRVGPVTKLGVYLWRSGLARASCSSVTLVGLRAMVWKAYIAPIVSSEPPVSGNAAGVASPRGRTGVMVANSFKFDQLASRRIYLPGMPAAWEDDGLLNHTGARAIEGVAKSMVMGLDVGGTGAPVRWMLAFPRLLEPDAGNPHGVAFRKVEYVLPMQHTTRAPDNAAQPWP